MELEEKLELRRVITIFQPNQKFYNNSIYIEQHDVGIVNGKAVLCAGRPLEKSTISAMAKTVLINSDTPGYLPANLLSYSDKVDIKMLWWVPAQKRKLFFHKNTGIPSGDAHIPAMLFYVKNATLCAYALKRKRRPLLSTRVY